MSAGKGSLPSNCFSKEFKSNYDEIDWSKPPKTDKEWKVEANNWWEQEVNNFIMEGWSRVTYNEKDLLSDQVLDGISEWQNHNDLDDKWSKELEEGLDDSEFSSGLIQYLKKL